MLCPYCAISADGAHPGPRISLTRALTWIIRPDGASAITTAAGICSSTWFSRRASLSSSVTPRIVSELRLRGAFLGDRHQPLADRLGIGAEVVEPRQLGKRLELEDALEERGHAVAHRAAGSVLAT